MTFYVTLDTAQSPAPPPYESKQVYRARTNAGVFNRGGTQPGAPSRLGLKRPTSNRVQRPGLYDDLPPPADWDEAAASDQQVSDTVLIARTSN